MRFFHSIDERKYILLTLRTSQFFCGRCSWIGVRAFGSLGELGLSPKFFPVFFWQSPIPLGEKHDVGRGPKVLEMRDGDKSKLRDKGILKAVVNIIDIIAPRLLGMDVWKQPEIDKLAGRDS